MDIRKIIQRQDIKDLNNEIHFAQGHGILGEKLTKRDKEMYLRGLRQAKKIIQDRRYY